MFGKGIKFLFIKRASELFPGSTLKVFEGKIEPNDIK